MLDQNIEALVHKAIGLPGDPTSHRIVVAMSGGVDSSVAAALVKLAGYETVGITLQLYDHGEAVARKGACCAGQDIHDARRVASHLGIAHYVLDYESRFSSAVIDEFADSYVAGETPVPCITCNQTVKFSDLLSQARQLGASALVTGHYVESRKRATGSDHRDMLTPADMARDQSYFLFATTQQQLDFLRFPLASLSKQQIRQIASGLGLDIAAKPDSQDICFVPEGRYGELIARLRPHAAEPGDIVDINGRVVGRHQGIVNFTIGQRRGIGIAGSHPLYVTAIDASTATITVGPREALKRNLIELKDLNWIAGSEPASLVDSHQKLYARVRSTRPPARAQLVRYEDRFAVRLDEADYGISPGQACVLYEATGPGAKVLGGGFIRAARQV